MLTVYDLLLTAKEAGVMDKFTRIGSSGEIVTYQLTIYNKQAKEK